MFHVSVNLQIVCYLLEERDQLHAEKYIYDNQLLINCIYMPNVLPGLHAVTLTELC